MGLTLDGVYAWTHGVLSPDAALATKLPGGVHRGSQPQQLSGSALIYQFYTGSPVQTINGTVIFENITLTVKAVGKRSDFVNMVDGFKRALALLHQQSGMARDTHVFSCIYTAPVAYDEDQSGVIYEHFGGRFLYESKST